MTKTTEEVFYFGNQIRDIQACKKIGIEMHVVDLRF